MTGVQPREGRGSPWRPLAFAGLGAVILLLVGSGVWAALSATATANQSVSSNGSTLSLSMTNDGQGFSTSITNMAIDDTVNRYVVLTNNGTASGGSLTLGITATGAASLITDGVSPSTTQALRISVATCTSSWSETIGYCFGTTTERLAPTVLSSLGGTPVTIASGPITVGQVFYTKITVNLPIQSETTVDGVRQADTVQGLTVNLTYSFGLTQRAPTTTSS